MSWIGPAAKRALKYGPYAQQAWKHAGKPAQEAAQRSVASWAARRTALQHAETLVEGSVLGVVHDGTKVWVVYSGDDVVAAYPSVPVPLPDLVAHADFSRRVTPAEARERQRVREVRARAQERVRRLRRRQKPELTMDPEDDR